MNDYYQDTWNDADQQVISNEDHYSEMQYLEDKVRDLEAQVLEMAQDEVYILSELMFLRYFCADDYVSKELKRLINIHTKDVQHKAVEHLNKTYSAITWEAL